MSAADRAVALAQANERLQAILWFCIGVLATIWCTRYALRLMRDSRARKHKEAVMAEARRRARVAQTELCQQRIRFLHGRTIYLPGNTTSNGHTVNSIRQEKAALN